MSFNIRHSVWGEEVLDWVVSKVVDVIAPVAKRFGSSVLTFHPYLPQLKIPAGSCAFYAADEPQHQSLREPICSQQCNIMHYIDDLAEIALDFSCMITWLLHPCLLQLAGDSQLRTPIPRATNVLHQY